MPEKDYQPDGEAASGHLRAGQIIAPWISLGPFYEDVSSQVRGLTRFERSGSDIGGELLDDIVAEADPLLRATPREGDGASFRGQAHRWAIARRPEQFLSWGEYFLTNHLAAIFLSTRLMAGSEGRSVRWRLVTRISSRAVVAVNGEIVIDTDALAPRVSADGFEYHFTAPLQAGENVVTAGLFRLGRMGQVGFRLELVDDDAWALAPLIEHIAPAVRTQIEDALAGVSLERDILYPSDQLRVQVETAPHPSTRLELSLDAVGTGDSVARVSVTAAGSHIICDGAGLADGFYTLVCRWSDGDQGHP
ncbi:hypothetical protein, partial [Pseudactinotalea sp.]|uniref:hypothetical protein n=1 Tax=Pseudactinotalea sp. TaxID=1926260 RepID=UPI003B3A1492